MAAVRVVDHGANAVLRNTAGRKRPHVDVGVLGQRAGAHKGAVTVAQVAEWAEFGIGQPQRSWLRAWIDANENLIQDRIDTEMRQVLRGKSTPERALARVGVWLQGELQMNIANHPDNGFATNAPSTIARKGSSTPLIDKGQLRASISHRVGES